MPRSPQGHPVLIQAGDSDGGRELAAKHADVIFSRHSGLRPTGRPSSPTSRAAWPATAGADEDLKIIPAATAVVADTDAEAA